MQLEFETADVFAARRFEGNALALVYGAETLEASAMQRIAREFNLSQTVFVLPPRGPDEDAFLRMFAPLKEMSFAGHPNVGAAALLGRRNGVSALRLGQAAGMVHAVLTAEGAEAEAPQPLALGAALDPGAMAQCVGLPRGELRLLTHAPVMAGCGASFAVVEAEDAAAVAAALPDVASFDRYLPRAVGLLLHAPLEGGRRRARMFAPLAGVLEDPAAGCANMALAGLLLERAGEDELCFEVEQGADVARPALMRLRARRDAEGRIHARVGGAVVPVARGMISL